jgi:hypothetical protein
MSTCMDSNTLDVPPIACDSADVIAMVADRDACNQDGAIRVGRVH